MSQNTSWNGLSARRLCQGLAAGEWSSEELTGYFLEQIAASNPHLHAVHSLNPEARAEARKIDGRRRQGEALGPLAGLPMTLKDAFACRGLLSTYGTSLYAHNRPAYDSQVVASLRAADLVFLGRSAVPTASFDWNCRNQIYPECVNPHDPTRTPGGSSGGAAAALAAGLTPLELGSDVAGSIRYPAHCCGVYGLRTSDGWLPFADTGPDPAHGFHNLAVCGPLARYPEDLSLLLDLFARDYPDSRLKSPQLSERPLRMAYCFDFAGLSPDADTRRLMASWLESLRQQGVQLTEAAPELDVAALNEDWARIVGYELAHSLPAAVPLRLRQQLMDKMVLQRLGPGWMRPGLLQGMLLPESDYFASLARCRSVQHLADRFFRDFDAWVLPVSPSPALRLAECGGSLQTHLGETSYSDYLSAWLCVTTLLGTPALSLPIGIHPAGLPVGLQVHGPRFADRLLLAQLQGVLRAKAD